MKCNVNQEDLQAAVKAVNRCLSRRPHLPILGGIHLKAADDRLELTTTDMICGLRVKIAATIEEAGETTVSGKNFVETVGFFDGKQTDLELAEGQILVKNGRDKVKIPILTEEFPLFDDGHDKEQVVGKPLGFWEFISKKVGYAASRDQSRIAMTGVFLKADSEKMTAVGTDGIRVAIWDGKETIVKDKPIALIVNAKAINDIVAIGGILGEAQVGFYHHEAGEQVTFLGETFAYFSKLINAQYPPYDRIVPLEFTAKAVIDKELFIRNLTKASIFTKADSDTVKMHLSETEATYESSSLGDGSFQGAQEMVNFSGTELDISFKIKYVLEFLHTCDGETIEIDCNGSIAPAILRDPSETELMYVSMPFKPKK